MVTISELRMKEIINLVDGKRIGFIEDFEINLDKNRVEAIVVPREGKFLKIFSREDDYFIPWRNIVKIGEDVILVDIKEAMSYEDYDEEEISVKSKMLDEIKAKFENSQTEKDKE